MLDHISLGVSDLERSRRFYDVALKPLGIVRLADFEGRGSDYGVGDAPLGVEFTITLERAVRPSIGMHLCLRAVDRQSVIDFYDAAMRCGATSDGGPGLRPIYHPDYFAAFVLDPDGHRLEAACHGHVTKRDALHPADFVAVRSGRNVQIRRAFGPDAAVVAKFARSFHVEDGHPLSDSGVDALMFMLKPDFENGLVLLLEIDGQACGYGALSFGYGIEHGGPETFIEDLYVLPEFRTKGLGRLLIDELERRAHAAGCRAIHLEVMRGNRAESWYRRLGWTDRNSQLLTKPI